jgi:hypothetical protein
MGIPADALIFGHHHRSMVPGGRDDNLRQTFLNVLAAIDFTRRG